MTNLQNPIFTDDTKAREALESVRWPNGPYCPHCGCADPDRIAKVVGKKQSHRPGLHYCNECKGQFTVTVGTVFERSKVPLSKWWLAVHLLGSSKKGMSAHQLHRMLGVTYKTAWFMAHRIREAMKDMNPGPMGGPGKIVEADETYYGKRDVPYVSPQRKGKPKLKQSPHKGIGSKLPVVSLVERGGNVRSFVPKHATKQSVQEILFTNVTRDTSLFTDESRLYTETGKDFAEHKTTNHSAKEYVRGEVHTNTIEGYFSIFKRGMKGIYQHCGEAHLHRYLAEFDFRYNTRQITDSERTTAMMQGIEGKRLTYRSADQAKVA
jgi:transposase-like protein